MVPDFYLQADGVRIIIIIIFFVILELWHMEVPRLAVKWELQPPAYATATAMQDPS